MKLDEIKTGSEVFIDANILSITLLA